MEDGGEISLVINWWFCICVCVSVDAHKLLNTQLAMLFDTQEGLEGILHSFYASFLQCTVSSPLLLST